MGLQLLLLLLLLLLKLVSCDQLAFTRSLYEASIPENPEPKRYVQPSEKMGVHVDSPHLQVRYKIIAGDKERQFKAESRLVGNFWLLFIRARTESTSTLNREYEDTYHLRVKGSVHDTLHLRRLPDVYCEVLIRVTDKNDLSPLFFPTWYNVTVPEDTPIHNVLVKLNAYDPDMGVNGEIYYRLLEPSRQFAVHPTMGTVLLTRPLDVQKKPTHQLTVVAEDRGPKRQMGSILKSSTAQVVVHAEAVNRHRPAIFVRHVHALVDAPEVWAVVVVTDDDPGIHGTIGGLAIVDGDDEDCFTVVAGSQPGEFHLRVDPERPLRQRSYTLTLRAWDQGVPSQFTDEKVSISPLELTSEVLEHSYYEADVPEEAPPGSPVAQVKARVPVVFHIESGNEDGHFVLNTATGRLSTANWLDYEAKANYSLRLSATSSGATGHLQAVATVTVRVFDCNDHAPVFDPMPGEVLLDENRPVGTKIFTVHARDEDEAENGYVSYSLVNLNAVPFSIDPFSGEIYTTEVLDHETMRHSYMLRIRATDWGAPYQRQTERALLVTLRDVNDHRPQFEKVDCVVRVLQNAAAGTQVLTLSAVDLDNGGKGTIHYKMDASSDTACFHLNASSGVLSLECRLQLPAHVNVTATDGYHFADVMTVQVHPVEQQASTECKDAGVIDKLRHQLQISEQNQGNDHGEPTAASFLENRHSPQLSWPKELAVNESTPLGSVLGYVQAKDPDHGYNGRLVYVISSGDQHSCFRVDMHTGALMLVAALDYELAPSHLLNVTVYDQGRPPRSSSQTMFIRVLDVNDNVPLFEKPAYNFVINEDAPNGTSVARLRAADADQGRNSELHFILSSEQFHLDSETGLLTIKGPLDRERHDHHMLTVTVADGALEYPLSSMATVNIVVRDVNDNVPHFARAPYVVRIREDLPIGALVTSVHAEDADFGDNGRVQYSLDAENFDVDPDTGLVRLVAMLDFETWRLYNVTVQARDCGDPPLTSITNMIVEVEDVNENLHAPYFAEQVISATVDENQPPGTSVTTLTATDEEGITYTITGGNGLGMFTIDNNGVVRTHVSLDHEACAHYWLTVVARDLSPVPLEAFVDLHVAVRDLNDQLPLTELPAYAVTVAEHSASGAAILTMTARDSVDWRLVDDAAGCFAIDRRLGTVTTICSLDREAEERHVLEVVLTDRGEPPLSSTTQVLVMLADINDHKPVFTQSLYRFRVLPANGQVDAVPLCQVLAVDRDDVNLTYSVVSSPQFSINPITGLLHAHVQLLPGDTHELMVQAFDSGSWPASAHVQLYVVSRPVTSGSAPVVHDVEVSPTLETDPVDHLVAIVHASDPDGDALWYSLAGGNEEGKFMIDCEHGFIKLARPLDRETRASYNLTVHVTDGSAKATATVHVEVLDANDNWPVFSESLYQVEVSESSSPGMKILQLTATDADEDQRLFYSIHNSEQVTSNSHFMLDSDTGVLSLALPLDHEASQQHLLTIAVRDSGGPVTRRGFARVRVLVTDHNDHAPEFLQARYEVRVSETAAPGTVLLQLGALDRDRGPNALLTFSLTSGSMGSLFSLDSTLGLLTLSRELSQQTEPEFFLTVRAVDHGEPPLNATCTVHVVVVPADNAPPHFVPVEQTIEAAENEPAGVFLLALNVHSSSSVFFQLEGASTHFRLDPVTGVLTTGEAALDFERVAVHRLVVRATNLAGASALAQVTVQVLDCNDHAPRFRQLLYRGTVSEAAPAGSAVLQGSQPLVVAAYDEDTGINAQLTFSIVEAWARRLFRIDPNTGAVSLVHPLDREQQDKHNFTVAVLDHGQPQHFALQPATVTIYVSDVNDSPPRFERELYNITLLLPTYVGVLVAQVAAHDPDLEGPNLRYSLVAGDHEGHFEVRPETGEVVVREPSGLQGLYRLLVSVTDGRSETATLVLVSVGRANVGHLRFAQPLWEAAVCENEPPKQRVLLLSLLGAAVGEPVHFSLLTPSEYFAVGLHSGLVRCLAPLDREKRALYELALEARSALAVAHAMLRVHVKDANDNAPIFVNRPYYSVITVSAQPGDLVLKVKAIDLDEGPNGQVVYSLHEGDGHLFCVDQDSGEIRLMRSPGRPDEYALVLVARDQGNPPLESHAGVAVKVTDEAMPIFGQHFYTASVAENTMPGTALLTVEAKGAHPLVFTLTSDHFAIDRATGVLSLVESLDYENQPRHELQVQATDSVSGAHSEVLVTVHVQDVNDCAPLFEQSWYNVSVSEAMPVASPLLEVHASDQDGPQLELRLAIDDNTFLLDAQGVLRLRAPLDREAQPLHRLQVVASDLGHPASLSGTARIWVTVIDMNDNSPAFAQPAYTAVVDQRSRRGQFVARLLAIDPDVSDQLSYAIVTGNDAQLFAINRSTGVVTVSSSVPSTWPLTGFELNVSVTDGVYQSYTQLRVVVRASNEHSPRFSQAVYEAVVAENLSPGARVAHVFATDPDQGVLGQLIYAIRSHNCALHFHINSTTGELVTQKPLDRERRHLYEVPVSATDGGGRLAFAVVRVAVTDVNDNEPTFGAAEYQVSIWTNTSVGTTLLKVRAFDQDQGNWLRYSLHEAPRNVSSIFNITHDSGELYLKAPLKGIGVFQFFVHVSDQGEPQARWAVAPVTVAVVSPLEELPSLELPTRDLFVQESALLGSSVLALPPGSTLTGPSEFSIDAQGNLVVAAPLDREHQSTHHLTLRKETSHGLATAFDVTVHVLDDNDCEPVFDVLAYKTAVAENAEQGCVVARLLAHDPDVALRKVTYEFYEDTDPAADIFRVDPLNGVVTTRVALDREAVPFYNFTVKVRDDGLLSSSAWVYVEVLDVNDNPPVFEHSSYQLQVLEDAVAGTVVASLRIEDADRETAPVGFYVLSGDPGQQFAVRNSGDVFVQRPLDRETLQNYTLTVGATDGLHVATTQLEITVLDSNDNPPICRKSKYTELVSESIPVGTAILTVEATDADDSSQLHFYLSGQGAEDFVLDASSGVLHTSRPLDREQRPHYSLVAHVRDVARWEWQCNSSIEVLLSDVNDNPPVFGQKTYELVLPEDTPAGRLVAHVHALDRDLGVNRQLSYSFVQADGHFSVDAHSGLVRLEQPLDREQCARFNLTVQAQDHGQPPLASRTHLAVTVQDINDSPPEFTQQVYAAAVSEVAPVGSPLSVAVKAASRDVGVNAQITYALVAGNDMGHFSIETKTGVLRVAHSLDYEEITSYQLTVEARDGGEPPLSARAWLNVSVLDANDNAPMFGGPYSATVTEDASPGQLLLQVQASDADSSGELRYALLHPGPFFLDPVTGQLRLAGPLDREMVSRYVLEVECWDGGTPPLSAQALVHVEVLDVNDHPPRFDQSNYTAVVHEGRQAGWTVLRFSLSDADSPLHGPPFRLQVDEPSFFRVKGHELQLARPLPPQSRHELRVRAYDSGSPPLSAEAHVTVLAIQKSRFRPQVQPLNVLVCSFLDDFPGGLLGTVHATDEDPYDHVDLSLSGLHASLFVLDRDDGTLRALPGLDAGSYVLNVTASDSSTPPTHAPVTVHVVAVSEELLKASIALRLTGTTTARFVAADRRQLLRAVRTALGVRLRDLVLVSVQPAAGEEGQLDVLLAVQLEGGPMPASTVAARLHERHVTLEAAAGLSIHILPQGDRCPSLRCVHGECQDRLVLDPGDLVVLAASGHSLVSARHSRHTACICNPGFGGDTCEAAVDECAQQPCAAERHCVPDASLLGYSCQCPSGRSGPQCNVHCQEPTCYEEKRPISFGGQSYAHYVLSQSLDRRLSFSVMLRTLHPVGTLLHISGPRDYAILEVSGGYVQYRFDCGSGEGLVHVAGRRVDDGIWHALHLEHRGGSAQVAVDAHYKGSGSAPGPHDVLNLEGHELHLGGAPAVMGLVGCLDDARVGGLPLPLHLRPTGHAQLRRLANVHFSCHLVDACGSQPCLNGATCRPLLTTGYSCTCPAHFQGPLCEEPVAKGQCTDGACEPANCQAKPCLHGGFCQPDGRCLCLASYKGDRCELVEACAACESGESCVELADGFQCGCLEEGLCAYEGLPLAWPLGGAAVLLLLLLLAFVCCCRHCCRHHRADHQCSNTVTAKNYVLATANIRPKISNLEQRPASYTTTREATLNNFDTVRSYGSAADDLESRYQPNDLRCHTPSASAPTKGLYLDKIPNDLKAALSPSLAPQSSATSIASDLPGYCWDYSDLAAHAEEEDVSSGDDEAAGSRERSECSEDTALQDERYTCHPDQYLPRHSEPAVCAIEDSDEEA
nr:fat-like cadherin-related tumor suppressor homolog [Rhipicephalus microplus]